MLRNLHVKNLALIDEAEVDFEKGLNILTGEPENQLSLVPLIWLWEKRYPKRC